MIYCNLVGGLCNMFFQIAATKSISLQKKTDCSFPNLDSHLSYLTSETTHNPNLSNAFEYNIFFSKLNKTTPLTSLPIYNYPFNYDELELPHDNFFINGFFQSEKYFDKFRPEILKLFQVDENIINDIYTNHPFLLTSITTSLHVRRGDYLNYPNHHPVLTKEYYDTSVKLLYDQTDFFVVFSDDINWCMKNFSGKKFFFVENTKDYISLLFMSLCSNNIIANSSFSWWGAWLNKNENKKVIAPKIWFGPGLNHNTSDIIPENWIKI